MNPGWVVYYLYTHRYSDFEVVCDPVLRYSTQHGHENDRLIELAAGPAGVGRTVLLNCAPELTTVFSNKRRAWRRGTDLVPLPARIYFLRDTPPPRICSALLMRLFRSSVCGTPGCMQQEQHSQRMAKA